MNVNDYVHAYAYATLLKLILLFPIQYYHFSMEVCCLKPLKLFSISGHEFGRSDQACDTNHRELCQTSYGDHCREN